MAENLFLGLPPPSSSSSSSEPRQPTSMAAEETQPPPPPPTPVPILKSALKSSLKRTKPTNEPQTQVVPAAPAPQKRLKFKMTVDASETQVIEAMQKIASHISNPSKFGKASKLAMQLIQAGSVKPGTSDHFFAILETAMSSTTVSTDPSLRADYHALFSAAQDVVDCFSKKQRNQLTTWTITAVVGNDLYTDDSFVFSKAAGRIKDIISSLPPATENDDMEEAEALKEEKRLADAEAQEQENMQSDASVQPNKVEFDPFGLDALLSDSKTDERTKTKKEAATLSKKAEEEESKRFLKSQREALIFCLEIAARRYRVPWCQTVIDILVKHAFDHKARFTSQQRDAIGKLWASILEQQTRRKQGKSVTGKLDMNGFEWLQEKYASEKISIRRAVGGGGDRKAQQWLG